MTRLICALLCLGMGTASAQTLNYQTPPASATTTLTPENLMWAAFYLDQHADTRARAHDFLRVREPQRHASNMHDEAALDAEVAVVEQEIADRLTQVDKRLRYTLDIGAVTRELKGTEASLATAFEMGIYDVESNFGSNSRYLPPLYELLVANVDHFSEFKLQRGVAVEYAALFRDIGPQTAYLRVELELVSLHQGHRFQTILRNIKWYRDAARTDLLSEKSDKRDAAQLIKSRMLSEGITFSVAPEHAYTVADERILETLVQNYPRKERTCEEQERERGHRVFLCRIERDFFGRVRTLAEYRYVGGRLAEVQVFHTGAEPMNEEQLTSIWHAAQYEHMGPSIPNEQGLTEWSFGSAQFSYDPTATREINSGRPFYRATALRYLALKEGKPGTEVVP